MPEANAPGQDPDSDPFKTIVISMHTLFEIAIPFLSYQKSFRVPNSKQSNISLSSILGFNNIWIKEGDEWKAAFITNRGLYEFTIMFFGLCDAPPSFQQMMFTNILTLAAFSSIWTILSFLAILLKNWITGHVMYIKCQFKKESVKYLGTIISAGQIAISPAKAQFISDWPIPTEVQDVQSFLGAMNFWQKFVPVFSSIACPLHSLT